MYRHRLVQEVIVCEALQSQQTVSLLQPTQLGSEQVHVIPVWVQATRLIVLRVHEERVVGHELC